LDGKTKRESYSFVRERKGVPAICPLKAWVLGRASQVVMESWHVTRGCWGRGGTHFNNV
jgi:hypothetical protein